MTSLNIPAGRRGLPARIYGNNPNPTGEKTQVSTSGVRYLGPPIAAVIGPRRQPPATLLVNVNVSPQAAVVRGGIPGVGDIRRLSVAAPKGKSSGPVAGNFASAGATGGAAGGSGAGGGGSTAASRAGDRLGLNPRY